MNQIYQKLNDKKEWISEINVQRRRSIEEKREERVRSESDPIKEINEWNKKLWQIFIVNSFVFIFILCYQINPKNAGPPLNSTTPLLLKFHFPIFSRIQIIICHYATAFIVLIYLMSLIKKINEYFLSILLINLDRPPHLTIYFPRIRPTAPGCGGKMLADRVWFDIYSLSLI